jgi:hypothetical protein
MPLLPMLETIRHEMMRWFNERREKEKDTPGELVSKVANVMNNKSDIELARRYRIVESSGTKFEIKSRETLKEYIVDLDTGSCRCRKWKAQGFPCPHAIAAILSRGGNPQTYANACFTKEAYSNTYKGIFNHPFDADFASAATRGDNNPEDEDEELVFPPSTRRPAGRPKKRRIRTAGENEAKERRPFRCSRCNGLGHSKRSCNENI